MYMLRHVTALVRVCTYVHKLAEEICAILRRPIGGSRFCSLEFDDHIFVALILNRSRNGNSWRSWDWSRSGECKRSAGLYSKVSSWSTVL